MAFLQSSPPRQPMFRAPPIVLWTIAALAGLHFARVLQPPARSEAIVTRYALIPARYSSAFLSAHHLDPGSLWERAVPFISYMGLHNDLTHLAINCLFLLAFGPIVAKRFGAVLFLVFFAVCGVIAAAVYLAFNWGDPEPVIGASGGLSGLMAAALRMLPTQIPWAMPGETPLAPIFSRQVLMFSLVLAVVNVIAGLTGLGFGGDAGNIAWQAHLGGYVAGLLLAGLFDYLRPRPLGPSLTDG
jgi:membrane associated rhomboid family serine protease